MLYKNPRELFLLVCQNICEYSFNITVRFYETELILYHVMKFPYIFLASIFYSLGLLIGKIGTSLMPVLYFS